MQLNTYKNFINGRYLNEGIRNTIGIVLPSLVMSYFGQLQVGVVISLGALCVSVTDSPGPVHHRVNGMMICNLIISIVAILVCYANPYPVLLGLIILIFGFVFSMLTVYGLRTSSIGIASLLIIILSLQTTRHGIEIWTNALYILTGGCWYLLFSVTLYSLRPYKIVQQILGDFIIEIGEYFRLRSFFYKHDPEYEKTYKRLLQQQVNVLSQQSLLSELLFKTRTIIRESTHTGRVLLKIYIDVTELFESIMTTFQDYRVLHNQFDSTGILEEIQQLIILLAEELNQIGLAVKSGEYAEKSEANITRFHELRLKFEELRHSSMNSETLEGFVSLGRIFSNLQHLTEKISGLHYYTSYDKKIKKAGPGALDHSNYSAVQDIRPAIFFNNLNFKSNIFRHALRVAVALLVAYIISIIFQIGHSYWILLTVVVILKPAYSLTKKRNTDRLFGTFLGIVIGVAFLYLVKDKTALLLIMMLFMASSYAFLRTNYFVSVLMMTPYLVIFFHILYPQTIQVVLLDRLADTAIGSVIAFLASLFFIPAWEHESIRQSMIRFMNSATTYYHSIASVFSRNEELQQQKFRLNKRDVLTELANVSDSFNRMLSEPKRYQKSVEFIHRFVVLSHMLTSHFASLSYYLNTRENKFRHPDLADVMAETEKNFSRAVHYLSEKDELPLSFNQNVLQKINSHAENLLKLRREEIAKGELETDIKRMLIDSKSIIDQFNHIFSVSADLARCSADMSK